MQLPYFGAIPRCPVPSPSSKPQRIRPPLSNITFLVMMQMPNVACISINSAITRTDAHPLDHTVRRATITVVVIEPRVFRSLRSPSYGTVNPFSKTHGAPEDSERHVGDLGNFETDGQGQAKGSVSDKLIKLIGPESVLGVSISL